MSAVNRLALNFMAEIAATTLDVVMKKNEAWSLRAVIRNHSTYSSTPLTITSGEMAWPALSIHVLVLEWSLILDRIGQICQQTEYPFSRGNIPTAWMSRSTLSLCRTRLSLYPCLPLTRRIQSVLNQFEVFPLHRGCGTCLILQMTLASCKASEEGDVAYK